MQLRLDRVRVTVPGTVADFGSGFRSIALSVGLQDIVTIRAVAGRTRITLAGEPASNPDLKKNREESFPTVVALHHLLETVGASQVGVQLHYQGHIPVDSGLGSHSARILAGLLAGRDLLGNPKGLSDTFITNMAVDLGADRTRVEAALSGALALSSPGFEAPNTGKDQKPVELERAVMHRTVTIPIAPHAFIPSVVLGPKPGAQKVPRVALFSDAAANAARFGLLVSSLTAPGFDADESAELGSGDLETLRNLLMSATKDDLRAKDAQDRIPASWSLITWLRDMGIPAFVSGPGPAVVTLLPIPLGVISAAQRSGWRVVDLGVAGTPKAPSSL